MSGAATLVGFPSFFSLLPLSPELKRKFKISNNDKLEKYPVLPARRAQSMSVLPTASSTIGTAGDDIDQDFADFEAEASQIEAHRAGLLLALEQSSDSVSMPVVAHHPVGNRYAGLNGHGKETRYPGLASHSSKQISSNAAPNQLYNRTQPHHPQRSRRVMSAPSVALTQLPPKLLDDLDAWDTDDFTLNEWVVPEVKEKAIRQQQCQIDVEDWDNDFEVGEQENLEVPSYMTSIQDKFKTDMLHMRQFALHIEGKQRKRFLTLLDLKVIQKNALALEESLGKHYEEDVEMLRISSQELFPKIQLLIQLAEFQEDKETPELSKEDLLRLNQMISENVHCSEPENVEFGDQIMTQLLSKISPLKRELVDYVGQLKDLMSI